MIVFFVKSWGNFFYFKNRILVFYEKESDLVVEKIWSILRCDMKFCLIVC